MSDKKLEINIDVTDWMEETLRDENIVTSKEDVVELAKSGQHTSKIARATIVSRELGNAPENIVRPSKSLLLAATALDVAGIIRSQRAIAQTPNGERSVNMFTGRGNIDECVPNPVDDGHEAALFESSMEAMPTITDDDEIEEGDDGPSYVMLGDPWYIKRHVRYLRKTVVGNRMSSIYGAGGDVTHEAEVLKGAIDEIVAGMLQEDRQVYLEKSKKEI